MSKIRKVSLNHFSADNSRTQIYIVLALGFALVASAIVLYVYRRGGLVDAVYGPQNSPGFRDTGIYARAAMQIFSGMSPYSDQQLAFRSGSYGVLIFGLLPLSTFSYICYQLFNLLGIFTFSIVLLRNLVSREILIVCLALGICLSCVREIFSTGQITGVIVGLIAAGYECLRSERIILRVGGAFLFSLALDLKPNLVIFFVISAYILLDRFREVWVPVLFLFIGHLAVDLYIGRILETEWLSTLKLVGDPYRDPSNTGTRTIWPLVRSIFKIEIIPSQIPTVLFLILGVGLLFTVWRTKNYLLLTLSFIVPAFYNYFHLYSFFPFAIILLAILIKYELPIVLGVLLPFLLVSGQTFGIFHLFFCVAISCVLAQYLYSTVLYQNRLNFVRQFLVTLVLVCAFRLLFQVLFGSSWLQEIIILNTLVFVGIGVVFAVIHQGNGIEVNSKSAS
jgi:hypothetical protein